MTRDPEIDAIVAVSTALDGLDGDARARVLRWAAERYDVVLTAQNGRPGDTGSGGASGEGLGDDVTDAEIIGKAPVFEHFAELFSKAHPATEPDKALVAAYWRQAMQGQDKWQAADLQKDLKNLGHAVSNITTALSSNIGAKPQRVIQLQKAGNTRQARKTYKVTHEGLVYVLGMLGGQGG